jgi:poly(hydroxyalkanoate) granule-associated protein
MVKKTEKSAPKSAAPKLELPAGLLDNPLAQSVRASAQQIWLAGMGAFAKAQDGRLKVFEALIKEGTSLQRKTQSAAEEKIGEVTDRMSAMAGDVTSRAGQHWDKLESIFEQRTARAMNKLGVPTAKDVDALIKRVDDLAAAVERLSRSAAPVARTAARPAAPTVKPAAKAAARPVPAKPRRRTAAGKAAR